MNVKFKNAIAFGLVSFAFGLLEARADIQTWNATTGDWSSAENWTTAVPADGDDVVITNLGALVLLSSSTPWLSSVTISNASLSFSNWNTALYVSNLTILNKGILTCAGPFTNNAMSNRVNLVCSNLFLATNGAINVQGKGYSSGLNTYAGQYDSGNGPGGGKAFSANYMCGGGYGGAGVAGGSGVLYTNVYGSPTAPIYPGSGGQGGYEANKVGSHGGGAVCITADQVVVNGTINADGSVIPTYWGHASGGSGGGIFITCRTITGTNGAITANGADAYQTSDIYGGGGGGGRIAVIYDSAAQSNLARPLSLRFSAGAGISSYSKSRYRPGDIGTLYFPDSYFFVVTNLFNGQWLAPVPTDIGVADLMVSNVWSRMPGITLTVTNIMTVFGTNYSRSRLEFTNEATVRCGQLRISGATLRLDGGRDTGPVLACSGNLTMTNTSATDVTLRNQGCLYIAAGLAVPGEVSDYGAKVAVGGEFVVSTNCWIYPSAHPTNGAVVLFGMRNLMLYRGGGFNADASGYMGGINNIAGCGPGTPSVGSQGASYGGRGTNGYITSATFAPTYGSSNMPVAAGSGAMNGSTVTIRGAYGGGSVQLRVTDTATVLGAITAIGGAGSQYYGGGGSGGGICITCRKFVGDSNGVLCANGGAGEYANRSMTFGGGGGGGRIAVWRIFDDSSSVVSNAARGGVWYNPSAGTNYAEAGTIVWGWTVPPIGSVISIY